MSPTLWDPLRVVLLQSVDSLGELGQRERGRAAVSDTEVWLLLSLAPLFKSAIFFIGRTQGLSPMVSWGQSAVSGLDSSANLCLLHPLALGLHRQSNFVVV